MVRARVIPKAIYYVSSSGSANNNGTSTSTPLNAAGITGKRIKPGDMIKFKAGETFELGGWTLDMIDGANISRYGVGANPLIIGSVSLSAATWTSEGSGIYSTPLGYTPKWIFISGVAAKWAETPWIDVSAVTSLTVTADLDAYNPVGATARFRERAYRFSKEYTVDAYNSGTNVASFLSTVGTTTDGYIKLFGKTEYMTSNGDWYFSAGTLYVKAAATPAGTDIRASIYESGIIVNNSSNVTIDQVEIQHYLYSGVTTTNCNNFTFTTNTVKNVRTHGLVLDYVSTGNTITGNNFEKCGFNGIMLGVTQSSTISQNTFSDIGMDATIPFSTTSDLTKGYLANGGAAINCFSLTYTSVSPYTSPVAITAEKNIINNVCYNGIYLCGYDHVITKNKVSNFCMRLDDGAAIGAFGLRNVNIPSRNGTISNNIVWNGIGNTSDGWTGAISQVVGIYIDNGSDLYDVINNTIYSIATVGIVFNWNTRENLCTGNNIMDCLYGFGIRDDRTTALSPDFFPNVSNTFSNNVVACRTASQRCMDVQQWNGVTTWNPFAGGDADNNIYIQPYGTNICYYRIAPNGTGGNLTDYTLATWKTKLGEDTSSTSQTNYITFSSDANADQEVKIQINDTDSSAGFSLPAGYKQPDGTVGGSVTVDAWESFIYLKQTAYP